MGATLPKFTFREYAIVGFLGIAASGCADNDVPPRSVATTNRDKRWNLDERLQNDRELIEHAQSESNKLVLECESNSAFQVGDFHTSVVDGVSTLPGVISVTASDTERPTSRIMHLISPQIPSKDDFLVSLKQMADGGVSQAQLDSLYDEYGLQIKLMQIEHAVSVRCLVKSHGLRLIYVESTTPRDFMLSQNELVVTGRGGQVDRKENKPVASVGTTHWIKNLQNDFPDEFQNWVIKEMPHWDSASAESIFKRINNSAKVVQKRSGQVMDAEIQAVLTDDSCCLIVGDANDFSKNASRIGDGKCEYIRIQTKHWQAASPLDPNIWGR